MKFILPILLVLSTVLSLLGQPNSISIDTINWEQIIPPHVNKEAQFFVSHEDKLWVISENKLYASDNEGESWELNSVYNDVLYLASGSFGLVVIELYLDNGPQADTYWLDTHISTDNGETFHFGNPNFDIPDPLHTQGQDIFYQASDSVLLYLTSQTAPSGTQYNIYSLTNENTYWEQADFYAPITNPIRYRAFSAQQDTVLSLGLIDSINWELTTTDFSLDTTVVDTFQLPSEYNFDAINFTLNHHNGKLFISYENGKIFYGDFPGTNWDTLSYPFSDQGILKIKFFEDVFQVNTPGQLWEVNFSDLTSANLVFETTVDQRFPFTKSKQYNFASDDFGIYLKQEGFPSYEARGGIITYSFEDVMGSNGVIWAKAGEWFRSNNNGENWTQAEGFPAGFTSLIFDFNDIFYLKNENSLFRSIDNGITWEAVTELNGANIFMKTNDRLYVYNDESLYTSTDGINFLQKTHPETSVNGNLIYHKNKLFYIVANNAYISEDNGDSWVYRDMIFQDLNFKYFSIGNELINTGNIQTTGLKIFTSGNEGTSWVEQNTISPVYNNSGNRSAEFKTQIDSLLFFNGTHLIVTQNKGQTIARLNSPFVHDSGFPIITRPGPTDLFQSDEYLFGFSKASGFYRTIYNGLVDLVPNDFSSTLISTEDEALYSADFITSFHPNPNDGIATLTINLADPMTISANWYTATGQHLREAFPPEQGIVGAQVIPLLLTDFPAGIYYLKTETKVGVRWVKVIRE